MNPIDGADWIVRIPASCEWLNANKRRRMHWTLDRDLTAIWRERAGWAAKQAKLPSLGPSRVIAELRMKPRRRAHVDPANFAPTAKPCVDGLVDAGVWPDDSADWVVGPDMRLGPPSEVEELVLHIWGSRCCGTADVHHDLSEAWSPDEFCKCGHTRGVHGGHDGLARCALRSCYCGAFTRVESVREVERVSDWDDPAPTASQTDGEVTP